MKKTYSEGQLKIIEAARTVIADKGISGATMRAIAETAGMSTGAIYHYYQGKEEVLYDVMRISLNASGDIAGRSGEPNYDNESMIGDILNNIALRFNKSMDNKTQWHLSMEALQGNSVVADRLKELYDDWMENEMVLMKRLAPGLERHQQEVVATIILASIEGLILQAELGCLKVPIDVLIKQFEYIFKSGFKQFANY